MRNPFEYEAANNLPDEDILKYYIQDHNFSRFIISPRNIFLTGERGTGKTMTLLFYSFRIEYKKSIQKSENFNFKNIGIHIPCKTPLIYKKEYELVSDFKASLISEHYLVLYLIRELVNNLQSFSEVTDAFIKLDSELKEEFEYLTGSNLLKNKSFLKSVQLFADKEVVDTQWKINDPDSDAFYNNRVVSLL